MKIFVCIKQVPDTKTKVQVKSDGSGIDESAVKWILNPYDEFAVEEAIKIKEASPDTQVIVASVGPKKRVAESIRVALAMGADEGILIDASSDVDSKSTVLALAKIISESGPFDLILTGKSSIDRNSAYVGPALAEQLKIPHAGVVSNLQFSSGASTAEREIEGGTKEIIELKGPCLITATKGLNNPRYPSLPGIMKAKKKPLKELSIDELSIQTNGSSMAFKNYQLPPQKPQVKMLQGDVTSQVGELVKLLKEESKVL